MRTARVGFRMQLKRSKLDAVSGPPNTAGLNRRQLDQLLDKHDAKKKTGDARRQFTRWPYRVPRITMTLVHPGGTESKLIVASRDLSCQGISLLHTAFVYPRSEVLLELPKAGQAEPAMTVGGVVVRCVHLQGRLHDIGVKFHEPIDARLLAGPSTEETQYAFENVNPEELEGVIVYAEDSELDQKLIGHYLRQTKLRLRCAKTADEAFGLVNEGCDLVLLDQHLEMGTGIDVVRKIRDRELDVPVLLLTADTSIEVRDQVQLLRVNGFLRKPVNAQTLLSAIGDNIMLRKMVKKADTTKDDVTKRDRSMMESFLRDLREHIPKLEEAIQSQDSSNAYMLCVRIKAMAPLVGFDAMGRLADKASQQLAATSSTAEAGEILKQLLEACQLAKAA